MNNVTYNEVNNKSRSVLVDSTDTDFIRVALVSNNQLQDFEYYSTLEDTRGSIYFGVIMKISPNLEAVFVKYKRAGRDGFLSFSEIDPAYLSKDNICIDGQVSDEAESLAQDSAWEKFSQSPYGNLRKNQVLLVQIIKEERGDSKGASLSTFITFNGMYCTFMPNRTDRSGISRSVTGALDRKRLALVLETLDVNEGSSVILHSSAIKKDVDQIKQDFLYLKELWNQVQQKMHTLRYAPQIVYFEVNLIKKILYYAAGLNVKNIIIEGLEAYKIAVNFARAYMPDYLYAIKLHTDSLPIFFYYNIDKLVAELFSNVIYLRSGGHIVINHTEALTAIDVNSGKNKDGYSIEDTALKVNLEAIQVIMMQAKLRKIAGLIIVDLICMQDSRNNRIIENTARKFTQYDKAKMQINLIDDFGILIISRQRFGQSITEMHGEKCRHCNGYGVTRSLRFMIANFLNEVRAAIIKNNMLDFTIKANYELFTVIMNEYRNTFTDLENSTGCRINFEVDNSLSSIEYICSKTETPRSNLVDYQFSESINESDNDIVAIDSDALCKKNTQKVISKDTPISKQQDKINENNQKSNNVAYKTKIHSIYSVWNDWVNSLRG